MNKETITTYYESDHDRLDAIFKEFQRRRRDKPDEALELFREFRSGLTRHILWEDEILFPVFENTTGMRDSGPTAVMRTEHRQIESFLEAIHVKLAAGNLEIEPEEQALLKTLFEHNMKEENILYPAIDRMLQEDERVQVFQKMESIVSKA